MLKERLVKAASHRYRKCVGPTFAIGFRGRIAVIRLIAIGIAGIRRAIVVKPGPPLKALPDRGSTGGPRFDVLGVPDGPVARSTLRRADLPTFEVFESPGFFKAFGNVSDSQISKIRAVVGDTRLADPPGFRTWVPSRNWQTRKTPPGAGPAYTGPT